MSSHSAWSALKQISFAAVTAAGVACAVALTGCGLGSPPTTVGASQHLSISGTVHGGQQPISNARVHLMYVDYTVSPAQARPAINPSGSNVSTDGRDYYVLTDANGNFTITGDYGTGCSSGAPAYLYVTQGNPGLPVVNGVTPNNSAIAEVAQVGTCNGGVFPATLQIGVTEASTVTTAYALAGYFYAGAASSQGVNNIQFVTTTLGQTGLNNAFATGMGLVNQASGYPLARTAAGATLPISKINLLADILASCINTAGPTSTTCQTLFTNATSDGTTSGTQATDTVTALFNIAHHPAANVANLAALSNAAAPFQPTPVTAPSDLTVALTYPSMQDSSGSTLNPNLPSIDAAGNIVLPSEAYANNGQLRDFGGSLTVLKNDGTKLFSSTLAQGSVQILQPQSVAIDPSGNGWLINGAGNGSLLVKSNLATGTSISYFEGQFGGTSNCIASDGSGNIYVCDSGNNRVDVFNNSGVFQAAYAGTLNAFPTGVAVAKSNYIYAAKSAANQIEAQQFNPAASPTFISLTSANSVALDVQGNIWATAPANNSLAYLRLSNLSGNSQVTITGGGLAANTSAEPLVQVVVDGAGHAWVPNYGGNSISALTNTGNALSPAASGSFAGGFQTSCPAKGLAIDGSGNVWVTCDIGNTAQAVGTGTPLVEFLGLATPTATPVLPANAGTRP